MSTPPEGVRREYPLARLTTVRTGGTGEYFARAGEVEALLGLLAWAHADGLEVNVVGSGSNLLISDAGVQGLVVKLDGELAAISVEPPRVLCGEEHACRRWPPGPRGRACRGSSSESTSRARSAAPCE